MKTQKHCLLVLSVCLTVALWGCLPEIFIEEPVPPLEPDAQLIDRSDFIRFEFMQRAFCPEATSTEVTILRWDDGGYRIYFDDELLGVNWWDCMIFPDGTDDAEFDPSCTIVRYGPPQRRLNDSELESIKELSSRVAVYKEMSAGSCEEACQKYTVRLYTALGDDFWAYSVPCFDEPKYVLCESWLVEAKNMLNKLR